MEHLEFLVRITVCFVLGIIIGIERQYRRKTAGVRTITLVSLGAFLFVSISYLTPANDITRIAAQVVSGIGFLGAGVILRDGTNIKGLNTAATLWCSAAVGTLTALGLILEAIIGVSYILLSNVLLRFVSRKIMRKNNNHNKSNYVLIVVCEEEKEMIVKNMLIQKLKTHQNIIQNFTTEKDDNKVKLEVKMETVNDSSDNIDNIVNRLCVEPGVELVEYNKLDHFVDDDDDYDYEVK
ncbi:MAG: MgtC/SapB family protein [Bacilli bacterium]|nr:MgtC/SapB family protein [Bacilli bacterium]